MKKRRLQVIGIILVGILFVIGYARFIEPQLLLVKSITIETKKPITPFTLTFFTDTHFGKHYDIGNVKKIVDKINETSPDIVVFGGDLLDNYARDLENLDFDFLKEELTRLKAPVGKYAVRGNHDYGGGSVRIYEEFMTSCGFKVLDNESDILENYGVMITGYDDYLMGWKDPTHYHIEGDLFNVILAHEPMISRLINSESDNFLLSGHTHGGQVKIPFFPTLFLPEGSDGFVKGFYDEDEIDNSTSLKMYTSSGIGMTRYPFRFMNPPEIINIKFKSEK